jgi:O-antigen ligase/polysaccharide polymerase Wzy-like membrane protein
VPAVLAVLLLATMLFQRPLLEVEWRGTFLVRAWDVVWLLFGIGAAVVMVRDRLDLHSLWRDLPRFLLKTPLGLFTLFAIASIPSLVVTAVTFGSSHFGDSVIRAGRFGGSAFIGIVLARYLTARSRHALSVFVIGLSAVSGLWAFLGWTTLHKIVPTPSGPQEFAATRGAGPFGNYFADHAGAGSFTDHWWVGATGANDMGFWLAMALGPACVIGLLEWTGRRRPRVLGLVAATVLALALGLAATHSREAWLAAIVGLAVSLWFQRARLRKQWIRAGLVGGFMLVVALFLAVPSLRTRLFESFQPGTFGFETGPRARADSWIDGLRWGWDRFPVGWGVGGIEEHPELFGHASSENVFIQAWASMGIVGAALLIGCFVLAIKTSAAALRRHPSDLAASLALSFFVVFVAHGTFGNTLTDPTIEILFGFALAVNLQLLRAEAPWRGP